MDRVISVHVPKTAGTTMRKLLAGAFGDALLEDYADDPHNPTSQRHLDPASYFARAERFPAGIRCIHGHLHPGKYARGNYALVTTLRHPASNAIAIYCYWQTLAVSGGPLWDYFMQRRPSVREMARFPLFKRLYSHSYFGGFDMERFDVVGRHEDRAAALAAMARLLDCEFDVGVHEHESPPNALRGELEADQALRRDLENILIEDVRFYDRWAGKL